MSQGRSEDPVFPKVTFDNYVIPETVQETRPLRPKAIARPQDVSPFQPAPPTSAPGLQIDPTVVSVGVIAILTFVLGVMATLKFTSPGDIPRTQIPVAAADPIFNPAPGSLPSASALAEEESVTRRAAPDILAPTVVDNLPISDVPALEKAVLRGLQPKRTVGTLTKDELAERAREARAIVNRNKLRMLREGVMAGVYTVTAKNDGDIGRLVLETVNAEMTRQSMGNLLLAAAQKGDIAIPASLITSDGGIDMDTMLFNLIQNSLADDGTAEGAEAALEMSRRAFAASSAQTQEVKGSRVYTVKPGDSLAFISLQFYGRPNAYLRIFEANRDFLTSPDKIQVGQRLIIPG